MKPRELQPSTKASPRVPAKSKPTAEASDSSSRVQGVIAATERYETELEARYVAARDAWTQAMQSANSGRSADMATLAIAQEAYETVMAERERWLAGSRRAIPVEAPDTRQTIEVAVDQELAWRRVLEPPEPTPGFLARIRRRFGGR